MESAGSGSGQGTTLCQDGNRSPLATDTASDPVPPSKFWDYLPSWQATIGSL